MPAMEAAASGVPVICARVGPLPEVLGEAAEWSAAPSVVDISASLERVLTDSGRRAILRRAGLDRAAMAPTWEQSANVEVDALRSARQ